LRQRCIIKEQMQATHRKTVPPVPEKHTSHQVLATPLRLPNPPYGTY
jgi:hypothetical protein